jgi:hypothetical protein
MPLQNTAIEKIWSYDYRSKGWSYETTYCNMVANPVVSLSLSWDTATGTWDNASGTWDGYGSGADLFRRLLIDYANGMYKCSDNQAFDFISTNISAVVESKDYDFGAPDTVKTVTRLSIKLRDTNLAAPLNFNVQVSSNRGRTWKTAGILQIPVNSDEGYVTFRATGSIFRFKLAISVQVAPFTIIEAVLRVRGGGSELNLGVSR